MAGPSGQDLDDAMVIDNDDDFFATAERLSQEEEDDLPTQGLLGLDGPVTPLIPSLLSDLPWILQMWTRWCTCMKT